MHTTVSQVTTDVISTNVFDLFRMIRWNMVTNEIDRINCRRTKFLSFIYVNLHIVRNETFGVCLDGRTCSSKDIHIQLLSLLVDSFFFYRTFDVENKHNQYLLVWICMCVCVCVHVHWNKQQNDKRQTWNLLEKYHTNWNKKFDSDTYADNRQWQVRWTENVDAKMFALNSSIGFWLFVCFSMSTSFLWRETADKAK
jgi:hypothetical protein